MLAAVLLVTSVFPGRVHAGDWQLALDLRAVQSDGRESFLDNGQGKLRYDGDHQGIRLGRLRAAWSQPLGDSFALHAEGSAWDDADKLPFDLTEAYLEYRPYPWASHGGGYRARARLGAFYPPMSLESRGRGWETPYTITPSAIGAWIGEEIRTIGLEGQLDWLGTRGGHALDVQLTAALFGWNDPAGTMLGAHGFAFHDRQTTLFGRVGAYQPDPELAKKEPFAEIDGRPGYYVGAQLRYLDRAVLDVLHYDNRGDPRAPAPALRDFAWDTTFDAAALRVETAADWTVILQALAGETSIWPGPRLDWTFESRSALAARRFGAHMLAARYDDFGVRFRMPGFSARNERGHAWTAAWTYERDGPWRFALEWLRVHSEVRERARSLGQAPLAIESKIELSMRYTLSGTF